jgi:AcrR family transcriptional regulator
MHGLSEGESMPKVVNHDERREAVVSLAAHMIAKEGIGSISFKGIADAAGASTAIVSHYFANKKELLHHTYRTLLGRSQREQAALLQSSDAGVLDLAEALLPLRPEMVSAWRISIEFFSEALTDSDIRREWEANLESAICGFEQLFDRMVADGRASPKLNSRQAAQELLALVRGIGTEVAVSAERWPPELQRDAVRRMLAGIETA